MNGKIFTEKPNQASRHNSWFQFKQVTGTEQIRSELDLFLNLSEIEENGSEELKQDFSEYKIAVAEKHIY